MFIRTLETLATFSLQLGLIGVDEYIERLDVALWLDDENNEVQDPRGGHEAEDSSRIDECAVTGDNADLTKCAARSQKDPHPLEFLWMNKWIFTKADPDPYPSTPHGHLCSKNNKWPKLNPYTGRVFMHKHQEDVSRRLRKHEMRDLWSDDKFRDFCRSHILWYMEQYPHHTFLVPSPLRLPRRA